MPRRFKPALLAMVSLVAVGATTAVAFSLRDDPRRLPIDRDARRATRVAEAPPQVLVVRRRGGVPLSWTRRLGRTGSGSLSLHAWGLAIDINAAANPQLGDSRQDRRLVRAMEDAGFNWGGRWPTVPDPMHFELHP